ncbi:Uncharacterised protein [Slackia heliotrinireducens]|uniref:HNH nuclease domain-containing protein n=1 Tax=Slackia heliotrinireducens (strain ATCC 29202 / DSM 20476 / NCTC 11029 / RHS 1) TaxID=471855 RepID=C7N267_SLAHD|nr:HNH endonuclease domain-containing protein [Slackia heliotrinireducens]ACV21373.1 hypothetical protein Shel_03050 [Slackia heliotrinireducens DSM 20476]VEG98805.1 Uncharacterised protein [Slackia heliotrinireducens]
MAELLGSQGMLTCTGDAFKSTRLERMLAPRGLTNSYKLLWLRGVFEEVVDGNADMSFARIVARMVAASWYPIVYYRLSFGLQDKMGECVDAVRDAHGLSGDAKSSEIIAAVEGSENPEVRRCIKERCKYVPHLLIRLFYEDSMRDEQERVGKRLGDIAIRNAIVAANRSDSAGAPYVFNEAFDGLTVDPKWAAYFRDNQQIVRGWLDMKLVRYLQDRNPSMPAIPLKIYPPQTRNLGAATRYWKEALALAGLREIYTGVPFTEDALQERGGLSIDHFIPWSFVLHDEPWNLVPMFKNANSSKGDRLPDLGDFLVPFASQQFDALMAVRNTGRHRKVLEAYLQIEPNFESFENTASCREAFIDDIGKAIRPLHQIARNQGFDIWRPTVECVYDGVREG